MANTYLSKTYGSSGNRQRQTISVWVKRTKLDDTQTIFWSNGGASYYAHLRFKSDNTLQYYANNTCNLKTKYAFLDVNAWYHIVITLDTTQATEADRLKIYVNGVQQTVFTTSDYPSQNAEVKFADDNIHYIGQSDSGSYFEGYMSHFHFVTNTAYQASSFGSTDSVTGEWKINTSPTVTYNTNSFFVFKDGNSGTDQSGQGNNYSVANGTLTKSEDCPSNVFPVINVLNYSTTKWNIINGNLSTNGHASGEGNAHRSVYGTIGASSGKYYFEMKLDRTYSSNPGHVRVGIIDAEQMNPSGDNGQFTTYSRGYGYLAETGNKVNNNSATSYGNSWNTNGAIVGCAFDLDNHKIYWSKNGTWQNSGVPTSGSTGTGSAFDLATGRTYVPAVNHYYDDDRISFNFGNGYFGTTAVSSAGTNASGIGIFEYDVPTGYTALSTKGLNL